MQGHSYVAALGSYLLLINIPDNFFQLVFFAYNNTVVIFDSSMIFLDVHVSYATCKKSFYVKVHNLNQKCLLLHNKLRALSLKIREKIHLPGSLLNTFYSRSIDELAKDTVASCKQMLFKRTIITSLKKFKNEDF